MSESKRCSQCKEEKLLAAFNKDSSTKDGLRCYCSDCARKYRENRKQTIIVSFKICIQCNTEKSASSFHKASRNKDGLQPVCKQCRSENLQTEEGSRKEYLREYYLANKEKLNAYGKAYQKTDKGKAVTKDTKYRRKLKLNNDGSTVKVIKWLMTNTFRCFWCNSILDKKQLDHFYPLSKGGTHTSDNFVIACPSCNMRKSDKDPEVFAKEIGKSTFGLYEEDCHEW